MKKRVDFVIKKPQLLILIFYVFFSGVMLVFSTGKFVINFKKVGFSIISGVQTYSQKTIKLFTNTFVAIKNLSFSCPVLSSLTVYRYTHITSVSSTVISGASKSI